MRRWEHSLGLRVSAAPRTLTGAPGGLEHAGQTHRCASLVKPRTLYGDKGRAQFPTASRHPRRGDTAFLFSGDGHSQSETQKESLTLVLQTSEGPKTSNYILAKQHGPGRQVSLLSLRWRCYLVVT